LLTRGTVSIFCCDRGCNRSINAISANDKTTGAKTYRSVS